MPNTDFNAQHTASQSSQHVRTTKTITFKVPVNVWGHLRIRSFQAGMPWTHYLLETIKTGSGYTPPSADLDEIAEPEHLN
jgi:hypothetical protein